MNYDTIEKQYNIKLDDVQKDALSSLIEFMESDERCMCLTGEGGTGKTLLLSMLYTLLHNKYKMQFVAPTNKAKNVLSIKLPPNASTMTIHQLLGLRPNLDILEFDAKQMEFDFGFIKSYIADLDLVVLDEASMINDDLYDLLLSKEQFKKFIFCGDSKQLAPVKQNYISKTFNHPTINLKNVYRQKKSILFKVIQYLRNKPLYKFKNVEDESGNIIVCNNIMNMLKQYSYLFKLSGDFNDKNLVKLVTYTNNRISALNKIIRNFIYDNPHEYEEREILTGYDTCICGKSSIENSRDYMVLECKPIQINCLDGYELLLDNGYFKQYVKILSRNNPEWKFQSLIAQLEGLRQQAVKTKSRKDWALFYALDESFLTPIDLIHDGRVIKRKSLDYGYCISAHKSQSSEYSIVMIDMENIWRCQNKEELRQIQYVACSRTKGDLIIYQKDD